MLNNHAEHDRSRKIRLLASVVERRQKSGGGQARA
jgi:hypothetical protein